MRVNDVIMRYITVRVDEDRKKAREDAGETREANGTAFEVPQDRRDGRNSRGTTAGITGGKYGMKTILNAPRENMGGEDVIWRPPATLSATPSATGSS